MPVRLDGKKIAALMAERGLTNEDIVKMTSLSPSTVDRVKNNRAERYSDHTVHQFAKALNCKPFELYKEEILKEAIGTSANQLVEDIVAQAVTEAVTVVVEEVAPETPVKSVVASVPDMTVNLPQALDIPTYIDHIIAEHEKEIETLVSTHSEYIKELRKEKRAWQIITAVLAIAVFVCTFFHLR